MKKYSAYKNSGIEWIGEIPEGWLIKKIKHTTYVKGRIGWKGLKSDEFEELSDSYVVTGTDFNDGEVDWSTCYQVSQERYDEDPFIQLQENDLLITKDGTIGKIALVKNLPKIATLNSGIFVTRPLNQFYHTEFMYWILYSEVFKSFYDYNKSGSTIQHLYQNVFDEFQFPCPSLEEQTTIANYLDHKTSEIDTLIEKKKKLIELYKEERTATINQAVTKGLDPNVPMKDSGIDWIGEIPEHWEVKKLKYISSLKGRLGWQGLKANEYTNEGPFVVSSAHFQDEVIQWEKCPHVSQERYDLDSNIQLAVGDILLMKDGAKLGKLAIVDHLPNLACLNSHLLLFRPLIINGEQAYFPRYLFYLMKTNVFQDYILLEATGTTFLGVSQQSIGNFEMYLPPLDEQISVVKWVDDKLSDLNDQVLKTEREIKLLEEYKTALISEVVLGKVDVREEMLEQDF